MKITLGEVQSSKGWIYQQLKISTGDEFMNYCEECGKPYAELHHIIFKSSAKCMSNIKVNFKYLCSEHHRGNEGPHMNRKKCIQYKLELQKKLFELFGDKEYFTEKEIKERLETTSSEAKKITKRMPLYKEGYERVQLVKRLMGGMLYAK